MSNPTAIPVEDPAVVTVATPQGAAFRVRRELEVYGVSCHPSGFLQRVS